MVFHSAHKQRLGECALKRAIHK